MQGHIALDQAIFPDNTPGFVLDAFARSSLWKIGLDYRHGTCTNISISSLIAISDCMLVLVHLQVEEYLLFC